MADGSRHSLRYVPEVTPGVTPNNPAFKTIRHTGTTLALSKEALQSEELRDDRQIADFRHGARQTGGDMSIELSYGTFDDILEALLGGTWAVSPTSGAQSLSATVGTFVRAAGSFLADGFAVGDVIKSTGFTNPANNGTWNITALTATVMTVTRTTPGPAMVVEAAAAGKTLAIAGRRLKAGVIRRTFTLERFFADISSAGKPYHRYTGAEFNTLALTIAANAMVKGTIGILGLDSGLSATALAGATVAPATTTSPMDSFTGKLLEAGVEIAVVTELTLNLDNGMAPRFVVGSKTSIKPSIARSNLTGQITAFFEDSTLLEKFINESTSSLKFNLPDLDGNFYTITIPRLKYTGGQPDVAGEGPIMLSMPFQAILDPATGTNIYIDGIPA